MEGRWLRWGFIELGGDFHVKRKVFSIEIETREWEF